MSKHFSEFELRCRCRMLDCDALPMQPTFMHALERLRVLWGQPLFPTSARRCNFHNTEIGGAPASMHLKGRAVDFTFAVRSDLEEFILLAEKVGFQGIGFGRRLVHIDNRTKRARWLYNSDGRTTLA